MIKRLKHKLRRSYYKNPMAFELRLERIIDNTVFIICVAIVMSLIVFVGACVSRPKKEDICVYELTAEHTEYQTAKDNNRLKEAVTSEIKYLVVE